MKHISLDRAVAAGYMWQKQSTGVYVDADGFNEVDVVAVEDGMSSEVVATVLFAGTPVMVVRSGKTEPNGRPWHYTMSMYAEDRGPDAQAAAAFLVAIGEADDEFPAYVAEHGFDSVFEDEAATTQGEGHELVAFFGAVANAVHEAYPDDTEKPEGF